MCVETGSCATPPQPSVRQSRLLPMIVAVDINNIASAIASHNPPAVVVTLGLNDVSGLLYAAAQLP
jgi:hypothetical protein